MKMRSRFVPARGEEVQQSMFMNVKIELNTLLLLLLSVKLAREENSFFKFNYLKTIKTILSSLLIVLLNFLKGRSERVISIKSQHGLILVDGFYRCNKIPFDFPPIQ